MSLPGSFVVNVERELLMVACTHRVLHHSRYIDFYLLSEALIAMDRKQIEKLLEQ